MGVVTEQFVPKCHMTAFRDRRVTKTQSIYSNFFTITQSKNYGITNSQNRPLTGMGRSNALQPLRE